MQARAFIDEGRICPTGRDLIAGCGDGVIAPYTTNQLGEPENPNPLEYGMRLARFNSRLEKLWDKPLPSTSMPGAATITGPAPFVSLTAWGPLLIRGADEEGSEVWQARAGVPAYLVSPLATLRMGDDVVAVCNYESRDSRDTDESQEVLLVFARPRIP